MLSHFGGKQIPLATQTASLPPVRCQRTQRGMSSQEQYVGIATAPKLNIGKINHGTPMSTPRVP
eukprot:2349301-Amphidinium_carterae.1